MLCVIPPSICPIGSASPTLERPLPGTSQTKGSSETTPGWLLWGGTTPHGPHTAAMASSKVGRPTETSNHKAAGTEESEARHTLRQEPMHTGTWGGWWMGLQRWSILVLSALRSNSKWNHEADHLGGCRASERPVSIGGIAMMCPLPDR